MAKKAARKRAADSARTLAPDTEALSSTSLALAPAPPEVASGLLIAVELGGQWPSLTLEGCERRVLVQLEGEEPGAFADRVTSGFDALFARGVELRALALCCNERLDPAADSARRSLVGLALGAMASNHAGRVHLTASPSSSSRLRHYLTTFAEDSRTEWQGAGLDVSVDFGREPAPRALVVHPARVA
jgi:hypothetical protein